MSTVPAASVLALSSAKERETSPPASEAAAGQPTASPLPAKQHFAVIAFDKEGGLPLRMQMREKHLAFINSQPEVFVQLGGPFLREDAGDMLGSMLVYQGTRSDVEAACKADPYFTCGLFESVKIEEWKWVIDAGKKSIAGSAAEDLCVLYCRDKAGALEIRKANRDAHLAYLEEKGHMVVSAGPLLDTAGNMCASVIILVGTAQDGRAFAAEDPYAAADLFEKVDVWRWRRIIDNRESRIE